MKIFCTSDWHLGNVFYQHDRLPEHRHFLGWLADRIEEQQPDALLIAGDVFDNANPSAAAQEAYYTFLVEAAARCRVLQVVIIAGNHDSAHRLEAPRELLRCLRMEVRGVVRRRDESRAGEGSEEDAEEFELDDLIIPIQSRTASGEAAVVLAVPFLRPGLLRGDSYSAGVNSLLRRLTQRAVELHPGLPLVMMAHMYATGAEVAGEGASERLVVGGQEQVDLTDWGVRPDFLTCGHIHKRQRIWGTDWARYAGSVLPMSFAETDYRHGVDVVTFVAGRRPEVEFLEYTPERRLMSLPREGAAELGELLSLIAAELPDRRGDAPSAEAVYLDLRLKTDRLNPEDRTTIMAAVERKDAIVCHLQPVLPTVDVAAIARPERFRSVDDVLNRDPKEAVRECFEIMMNGREMNERQLGMLDRVMQRIQTCQDED